jgi:hypothetical protein
MSIMSLIGKEALRCLSRLHHAAQDWTAFGWLSRKFRGRDMRRAAEKADVTPQSPTEFRSERRAFPKLSG